MATLAELARGPDITGSISRGAQVGGQLAQLAGLQRQRRAQEALDRAFAGGVPATPEARRAATSEAFQAGGFQAGMGLRDVFAQMDATQREAEAREGQIIARELVNVTDQDSYTAALQRLNANPAVDVSSLPSEFNPDTRTSIINAQRDLEKLIAESRPAGGEPFTLGEGQIRFDPQGQVIARGPEPASDIQDQFKNANTLRDEFVKQTDEFADVQGAIRRVEAAATSESGPGDLGLLIGYMKLLDPGSVVREGELATAATAGGVPETIRNTYNRLVRGERLSPELRQQFIEASRDQFQTYQAGYNQTAQEYSRLAESFGLPPAAVVVNRVLEGETASNVVPSISNPPAGNISSMSMEQLQALDPASLSDEDLAAAARRFEELGSGR